MSDLDTRIRTLEDIEEIRRLKAAYCAACDDDHNGTAVADLFVADGTWQRTGGPLRTGHDEIAKNMFDIRDAGFMNRSAHMVTNPVIDVDGDSASGTWRFVMMYTTSDDAGFIRIIGHYDDIYVRVDNKWLFRSLRAHVEEQGRYQAEPTKR